MTLLVEQKGKIALLPLGWGTVALGTCCVQACLCSRGLSTKPLYVVSMFSPLLKWVLSTKRTPWQQHATQNKSSLPCPWRWHEHLEFVPGSRWHGCPLLWAALKEGTAWMGKYKDQMCSLDTPACMSVCVWMFSVPPLPARVSCWKMNTRFVLFPSYNYLNQRTSLHRIQKWKVSQKNAPQPAGLGQSQSRFCFCQEESGSTEAEQPSQVSTPQEISCSINFCTSTLWSAQKQYKIVLHFISLYHVPCVTPFE